MEGEDPYVYGSPTLSEETPPQQHTQFLDLTKGGEAEDNKKSILPPPKKSMGRGPGKAGAGVRVVEQGSEQTGRWTKEEHEAFLSGLAMYGKEWKKVAARVKTRTVVQTRTHAQKYFQKVQKVMEGKGGDYSDGPVDMSTSKKSGLRKKKAPSIAAVSGPPPPMVKQIPRQSSVASAAHLISNLSGGPAKHKPKQQPPAYGMPPAVGSQSFMKPQQPSISPSVSSFPPRAHGFSTGPGPAQIGGLPPGGFASPAAGVKGGTNSFSMKITAPSHDMASKRGQFPEPSPAACGKRKLAEIAAARMLAGVAASSSGDRKSLLSAAMGSDIDGAATPPPPDIQGKKLDLDTDLPTAPFMASDRSGPQGRKPAGLSLQIVNPETLGVTYEETKRRRGDGDSPVTPWEGQLQQLVR
jgi:SHAQKYF class myb-like DNA-binding protein